MREDDPLDAWFAEAPPELRPWLKWLFIAAVLFGTVMSALWFFRG